MKSDTPTICLSACLPPPAGGMRVQAEMLLNGLRAAGVPVVFLCTRPVLPQALRFVSAIPGLRAAVRSFHFTCSAAVAVRRATVVHHFSASTLGFFLLATPLIGMCTLWNKRLIIHYHSGAAPDFLNRWGWIAGPLLRRANLIIVPSAFLQRVFAEHGLPSSVVPNVANIEMFPFRERRSIRPRMLVARHLEPIYDVECALKAFRLIKTRYPNAALGIVGGGTEETRLKNLARTWDLSDVVFYGRVPNEQMPEIYATYDIALNTSTVDNFPIALLEAALSGLPIVTTRAGGIPDVVEHGVNGVLVDVHDHQALASEILDLLRQPDFAYRLSLRARHWAQQLSWSHIMPVLLTHYGVRPASASTRTAAAPSLGGHNADH